MPNDPDRAIDASSRPRSRRDVALDALRKVAVDIGTTVDIDQKMPAWKRTCVTEYEARVPTNGAAWRALYATVLGSHGPGTQDVKGVSRHVERDALAR